MATQLRLMQAIEEKQRIQSSGIFVVFQPLVADKILKSRNWVFETPNFSTKIYVEPETCGFASLPVGPSASRAHGEVFIDHEKLWVKIAGNLSQP